MSGQAELNLQALNSLTYCLNFKPLNFLGLRKKGFITNQPRNRKKGIPKE